MLHYKSYEIMNFDCWFELICKIFGSWILICVFSGSAVWPAGHRRSDRWSNGGQTGSGDRRRQVISAVRPEFLLRLDRHSSGGQTGAYPSIRPRSIDSRVTFISAESFWIFGYTNHSPLPSGWLASCISILQVKLLLFLLHAKGGWRRQRGKATGHLLLSPTPSH